MKFWTLLKKELRESLGIMMLAIVAFMGIAVYAIHYFVVINGGNDYSSWDYYRHHHENYLYGLLFHRGFLTASGLGPILLFMSLGLGIALGTIHFWKPLLTRTWPFLIHRSTSRISILGSKITVSLFGLMGCLGLPWTWAYCRVNHITIPGFPIPVQILWEGWLCVALGFVVYLGMALSALSQGKWYGVRFAGLAFAVLVWCCVFSQSSFWAAAGVLLAGTIMLGIQLTKQFLQREF